MTDDRTSTQSSTSPFGAATDQLRQAGTKAAETSQALNGRIIDQAETNVREAFAALRAVASCTSITDVLKIQSDYVREQSTRNLAQAREVGELIGGFGRDTMAGMSPKS